MSDQSASPLHGRESSDAPGSDRRNNLALRELIDEMMVSIRNATQGHLWTSEERQQYERELAMIMSRVRSQAVGTREKVRAL